MLLQALFAAVVIVGPVFVFTLTVGVCKDGSPFTRGFWS